MAASAHASRHIACIPGRDNGEKALAPTRHASTDLCALTDSLVSSIRWRMRDYEAILRAELEILAEPDGACRPRLLRVASRPIDEN